MVCASWTLILYLPQLLGVDISDLGLFHLLETEQVGNSLVFYFPSISVEQEKGKAGTPCKIPVLLM